MKTMTIGNGSTIHTAYTSSKDGNLCGSLCNPYAWERSRVRYSDAEEATCGRCAKATDRLAEQLAKEAPAVEVEAPVEVEPTTPAVEQLDELFTLIRETMVAAREAGYQSGRYVSGNVRSTREEAEAADKAARTLAGEMWTGLYSAAARGAL